MTEGTLSIDVLALYLEYHTVSTHLEYLIYKDKNITFSFVKDPVYTISSDGTVNDDYIEVEAKINGDSVTEEEWSAMIVPEIALEKVSRSFKIDEPVIEKTATPGIYRIQPVFPDGKPSNNKYENCNYIIKYNQKTGNDTWYGSTDGTIKFDDTRSWLVSFSVINDPTYTIDSNGIETSKSVEVEAKIDGRSITPEEWAQMNVPNIALERDSRDFKIDEPVIEKTETPGIYRIRPVIPGGKPSTGTYKDCNYTLKYQQEIDGENWSGEADGTIKLNDTRSWWERNWDLFIKLIVLAAILFVLAGYLPFIKHYLPKSLKKNPTINCTPDEPGIDERKRDGLTQKNFLSTIIPYISQRGTIQFVPDAIATVPSLEVKAVKGRRMLITNIQDYRDNENISFNGRTITEKDKKYETSSGLKLSVVKNGWTYDCKLNG